MVVREYKVMRISGLLFASVGHTLYVLLVPIQAGVAFVFAPLLYQSRLDTAVKLSDRQVHHLGRFFLGQTFGIAGIFIFVRAFDWFVTDTFVVHLLAEA